MGLVISRIVSALSCNQDTRILMLGLDASGKTTMLYKLKLGEFVTSVPTIGFNVETVSYKNLNMTIWDVGGQDKVAQQRRITDWRSLTIAPSDSSTVAPLLPEHPGHHLRGGLQRSRAY